MGYPFIAGEFSPRKIPLKWMIMSWGTPIYGNHHMIILVRFGLVPEMQPGDKKKVNGLIAVHGQRMDRNFLAEFI